MSVRREREKLCWKREGRRESVVEEPNCQKGVGGIDR